MEELNSLESKCMDGNHITCDECPFASLTLCNNQCQKETKITNPNLTPYERTRNKVYATGNKWAIENFNATH